MKIGDDTRPPPQTALYGAVMGSMIGAIEARLISTIAIPAKVPFSVAESHLKVPSKT